jgi:hypothetical protein
MKIGIVGQKQKAIAKAVMSVCHRVFADDIRMN